MGTLNIHRPERSAVKMGDTSENSMTTFMKYEESTDQVTDSFPVEKFRCSLCGFEFSQQKYLTNHFKHCKDVEDPADRLGADRTTIKKEIKTEDEMHSVELFDEHTTTEPTFDIKLEEFEFTETTIIGTACPQSGQPPERLMSETPEDLFTLTKGDYTTTQPTQLEEQVYVHKPLKCTVCDYASAQRTHLIYHMRTHTGEKPFKCTMCEYSCAQKPNLERHNMRRHTGEKQPTQFEEQVNVHKPFKCTVCDYASAQRTHLIYHMRTHTGEKPFKCTMCEYSCAQKPNLERHMRRHTGEKQPTQPTQLEEQVNVDKPFKCTVCDYASAQRTHLIYHMRTHTGEKPFKCTMCEYSCAQKPNLERHMRRHTGEKPYKCTICDYAATRRACLIIHRRKH